MKKNKKTGRMQEDENVHGEEVFSVRDVLKNLMEYFGFKTNKDLAAFLDVRPNTISTWKKRNSLDFNRLITVGKLHKVDFNKLFSHDVHERNSVIVVPTELQYQYVSQRNDNEFISTLPKYSFPFSSGEDARAFQVTDFSSFTSFKGISYVVGNRIHDQKTVIEGKTYVFVNIEQGIFIGRAERDRTDSNIVYVVSSDNKIPPVKVKMNVVNIVEIWKVTNVVFHDFVD